MPTSALAIARRTTTRIATPRFSRPSSWRAGGPRDARRAPQVLSPRPGRKALDDRARGLELEIDREPEVNPEPGGRDVRPDAQIDRTDPASERELTIGEVVPADTDGAAEVVGRRALVPDAEIASLELEVQRVPMMAIAGEREQRSEPTTVEKCAIVRLSAQRE